MYPCFISNLTRKIMSFYFIKQIDKHLASCKFKCTIEKEPYSSNDFFFYFKEFIQTIRIILYMCISMNLFSLLVINLLNKYHDC